MTLFSIQLHQFFRTKQNEIDFFKKRQNETQICLNYHMSILCFVCHIEFFENQFCNEIEKIEMKNILSLNFSLFRAEQITSKKTFFRRKKKNLYYVSRLSHKIFRESILHLVCYTEFFKSQFCNEIEKIEMKNISSLDFFFAQNKSRRNYHVFRLLYRIHRESILQRD